MTITPTIYGKYKEQILDNTVGTVLDIDTDTIKVGLVTSTYTPAANTDQYWTTPVANEVSGTNYTAGGATATVTVSSSSGTITVKFANITWTQNASGFTTARYAVAYKSTGTNSTSPLICYWDLVSNQGNVAGDLVFSFDQTNGVFQLS